MEEKQIHSEAPSDLEGVFRTHEAEVATELNEEIF
jgi:hypothetical protein